MRLQVMVSAAIAAALAAGPSFAQELTGTLKKIKDTGAITLGHRESSVPFSYYDDKQQVVGYAMDLCARIVDGVKKDLKLANLETKLNPVTSATRIPLIANGTVDLRHHQYQADHRDRGAEGPQPQHSRRQGPRRGVPDGGDRPRGCLRHGRH